MGRFIRNFDRSHDFSFGGMFEKLIIVDCKDHLLGRIAAFVAKQLLNGQKIVLVRCEYVNISGGFGRNCMKFSSFLRKRTNSNPRKGPFHFRSPARIMWRAIRGMVPHKLWKGKMAMARLKCFEGIPHPYDKMKRMAIPVACRSVRLRPDRKYTILGDLAQKYGWHHKALLEKLEEQRKKRSKEYYKRKKLAASEKQLAIKLLCTKDSEGKTPLRDVARELAKYGY